MSNITTFVLRIWVKFRRALTFKPLFRVDIYLKSGQVLTVKHLQMFEIIPGESLHWSQCGGIDCKLISCDVDQIVAVVQR